MNTRVKASFDMSPQGHHTTLAPSIFSGGRCGEARGRASLGTRATPRGGGHNMTPLCLFRACHTYCKPHRHNAFLAKAHSQFPRGVAGASLSDDVRGGMADATGTDSKVPTTWHVEPPRTSLGNAWWGSMEAEGQRINRGQRALDRMLWGTAKQKTAETVALERTHGARQWKIERCGQHEVLRRAPRREAEMWTTCGQRIRTTEWMLHLHWK